MTKVNEIWHVVSTRLEECYILWMWSVYYIMIGKVFGSYEKKMKVLSNRNFSFGGGGGGGGFNTEEHFFFLWRGHL